MTVMDYLFNTASGQPAPVDAPAQQQDLISLLMRNSPGDRSPLQSEQGATREAIDYLRELAARPVDPLESGTPAGSPAPNAGGFNSTRGLGTVAGMAGSLAGGPIGGALGRGLGTAIGSFSDASRANAIAADLGLGPVADPAAAAAAGLGRSGLQSAAALGLASLGLGPAAGLAGRAINASWGGPTYGTDIGTAIANNVANRADLATALDREDMALGLNMRANAAIGRAPDSMSFGMDPGYANNPSFASSDYYDSGMSGMGGETGVGAAEGPPGANDNTSAGYAARGGLATADKGFVRPKNFANGGVVALPGGGKVARGPGGGLDDLIPTSIDGRRAAALSDGEFVIPADVVSMMGDGSSNAGSRRLYDMVRSIRQEKTGTSRQAGPIKVGDILKRIMQ